MAFQCLQNSGSCIEDMKQMVQGENHNPTSLPRHGLSSASTAKLPAAFHADHIDHIESDLPPWPFKLAVPPWVSCADQTSTVAPSSPEAVSEEGDADSLPPWVTTLTVKNLPSRTTPVDLMRAWECDGSYDFLYLPFTVKRGRPSGYAFINFSTNSAAAAFYRQWHGSHLRKGVANRKLNVTISARQGFQENLKHCACLLGGMPGKYAPALFDPTGSRVNQIWVMQTLQYMASSLEEAEKKEEHSAPVTL